MKYMLLMHMDPAIRLSPMDQAVMAESLAAWLTEMDGRGVRLEGNELADASLAKVVRIRKGSLSATDGPFVETKEQIAGFDIIECADLTEAVAIASKHPVARYGSVEVREFFWRV